MSEEPEAPPDSGRRRAGRAAVAYWLLAGAVYVALGVAFPPVFLLGFQEALVFVLIVTALAPWVLRHLR